MHSSRDAAILNWSGSCIMYDGVNKSEESINCLWLASRFKEPIFGGLCLTPWKAGELGIDEGWWSKANEVKAEGTMKLLMVGGKLENGSTCMSSISSWGWISNLKGRDLVLNERWRTFFWPLKVTINFSWITTWPIIARASYLFDQNLWPGGHVMFDQTK